MANPNAKFGLRPARSLGAANTQASAYVHDSGDGVALFIGDPVVTTGTSASVAVASTSGAPVGTPIVAASGTVTTGAIRGAVASVNPTLTNLALQYGAASTTYMLYVYDDPFQLFDIQASATAAVGDVSGNAGLLIGTGSTVTGLSAYQLDSGALGSTNVLRIIRLAPVVSNALGTNGVYEVKINVHELISTTGT